MRQSLEQELAVSAKTGDTARLITALEEGAPFVVGMEGETVLHVAATAGQLETVEALLDRGCDANVQDFTGHTALQRAAGGGHLAMVEVLVQQGASLDHQDELHGNTALHEAAWKGFSRTVSSLCQSKANVYMKNRGGFTALHLSCQSGHNQSCRTLLLHGCRPDVKNNYGDTPFHTAARYGHAGVIRILISAKCRVSEQNKNGDTALHIAAAMGRKKLTRILVEGGTDTNVRNKQNETALDIAVRKKLSDVVTILECNSIQNIISDLEPSMEESPEVRELVRQREREGSVRQKQRKGSSQNTKPLSADLTSLSSSNTSYNKNNNNCNNNSNCNNSSSNSNNIRAEQKYRKKSRSRKGGERSDHCDCGPLLERIGKTIEKDKKDILSHLDQNNKKINTRLESFEKRTKNQMFNFNQNMKESFANERNDCQERMERRFLKDNIEMERQRAIRDIMIKRDIARWLQARLAEIETRHGLESVEDREVLRKLTRRKSRRETRAVISEMKNGTLRRTHSAELVSELEEEEGSSQVYRGLRISDRPNTSLQSPPVRTRVRHNSEGNYDDVSLMQETILTSSEPDSDRVYQNLMFHKDLTQFRNEARVRVPLPRSDVSELICSSSSNNINNINNNTMNNNRKQLERMTESSSCSLASLQSTTMVGDTGSLDSHNDSGYSTRLGVSDAASPSLSTTDSEPVLDPQAIYMIPADWDSQYHHPHHHSIHFNNNNNTVAINSKSSLV